MADDSASLEVQVLNDDLLSPEMPVAATQFPTIVTQSDSLMNRSLENILLDTSPVDESIDLNTSDAASALEQSLPSSSSITITVENRPVDALDDTDDDGITLGVGSDKVEPEVECGENDAAETVCFEDIAILAENIGAEQKPERGDLLSAENEVESGFPDEEIVIESGSRVSIGETVPVGFEEEKGMRAAGSARSLMNFFTDNSGGTDVEGKGFFDSFTTGEADDEPSVASPPLPDAEKVLASRSSSIPSSPHVVIPASPAAAVACPVGSPATKMPFFQVPGISGGGGGGGGGAELEVELRCHLSLEGTVSAEGGQQQGHADAFIAGMTNDDRRFDAWIPSEMTRQALVTIMTAHHGSAISLPPTHLCMPGIVSDEALGDPVKDLVQRYMGDYESSKRVILHADSVSQDEAGLCQLIKAGCLRSAVDLTGKLLKQWGQGPAALNHPTKHSPYSIQLWFCRLALLIKLKLFPQAEREFEPFGNLDSPDLYYEYYQDVFPMRRGSLVPFDMRILHAELPQHIGRTQDCLDRLCYMMAVVAKMLSNLDDGLAEDGSMLELNEASRKVSKELWQLREVRILYSLGSCLLGMKHYGSAIEIYKKLIQKDEKNHVELLSAIGRIFLQMGDTDQASHYFHQVETSSSVSTDASRCQNLINRGLVALGNNQFSDAYKLFKEVIDIDKTNVVAVNNMAVCALYLGRLKESLSVLESLVHVDPARNLLDGVLLNLSTLYELESSRALQKKQGILSLVGEHRGDGFNLTCLKLA